MQGNVAVSHAYSPRRCRSLDAACSKTAASCWREAGVAIMTNAPGCAALSAGRSCCARPASPSSAAATTSATPGGPMATATCCGRAMMIGYRSGFNTDEELTLAFDIVTRRWRGRCGWKITASRVGAKADFVAIDAPARAAGGGRDLPRRRAVYKNGRLVARDGECRPKSWIIGWTRYDCAKQAGMAEFWRRRMLETPRARRGMGDLAASVWRRRPVSMCSRTAGPLWKRRSP